MDDEAFRDELVIFSLEGESNGEDSGSAITRITAPDSDRRASDGLTIDALHRPRLLPLVIRLVYGRLAGSGSRGRAGGHGGPAARRAAVLAFLSGLHPEELAELFALMVRPFLAPDVKPALEQRSEVENTDGSVEKVDDGPADWDETSGGAEQARTVLSRVAGVTVEHLGGVSASRQAGFLKMVKEVAKQLGQRALPYVDCVLRLVLALLEHSNVVAESERQSRSIQRREEGEEEGMRTIGEGEGEDEGDADDVEGEEGMGVDEDSVSPSASMSTEAASTPPADASSLSRRRMASGTLRTLCLRAMSELFSQFSSTFDFHSRQDMLWPPLADPIARLPGSTVGAVRAPALLALAGTITESESLLPMLSASSGAGGGSLVPAVLDCISAGSGGGRAAGPAVVGAALTVVERLLTYDGGSLLGPHLNRLISNFTARLSVIGTSGKGQGGAGGLDAHLEQTLTILARIAEMATSGTFGSGGKGSNGDVVDASSMSQLVTLLMPALQPDRRASDEAKSSVLRTITALARRVDAAGARRAWPALSRLLGPAGARPSGMAAAGPRSELVHALEALASRPDLAASAEPAAALVAELNARDPVTLDEPDFTRAVPAYNSLSEGSGWRDVIAAGGIPGEAGAGGAEGIVSLGGALAATPIAQHCFHAMHEQEVAVRGAAAAALKRLVREVRVREQASAASAGGERCPWEGLMRTVVMPGLRAGMACRMEMVRKGYISLLRETVAAYQNDDRVPAAVASADDGDEDMAEASNVMSSDATDVGSASVVPADLWALARDEDPESDFFLNACHMQVHRRARALAKARKAIEDSEATAVTGLDGGLTVDKKDEADTRVPVPGSCPFRVSTLVHFVLPLALHPLYEAAKVSEAGLVDQAVQLTGAIARHLPWTHYNAALRNLIQQVASGGSEADGPEKERAMISTICEILSGFHFPLNPPTATTSVPPEATGVVVSAGTAPAVDDKAVSTATTAVDGAITTPVAMSAPTVSAAEAKGAAEASGSAAAGDAVWRAVNGRLMGSLRGILTKAVKSKSGGTEKVLRAPVALGMLSLVRRLPLEEYALQLQPLIMAVCQSLKSRDSHARDTGRDTLAKMARELGPDYLQQVSDVAVLLKGQPSYWGLACR